MALYLVSIIGGDGLIILINFLINSKFYNLSPLYIILGSILAAIGVIAIDGILATFIRRALPEKWFDYKAKIHTVPKWEIKLYDKLGVKNWKNQVLELGVFTNFSKKKIADPRSREYIERFILECNYGAVIHLSNAILGFLLILFYPKNLCFFIPFPACVINLILSMLPYMILRYNVPRLMRTRDVLEKKELRNSNKKFENE